MSRNPNHPDQNLKIELSEQGQDPGRAKPTDFKLQQFSNSDGAIFTGQTSPALVAESQKMRPNQPIPDRNYVPKQ